jgi:1-acyl-sn-glycerol-3-phosphate acyltransferase
MLKSSSTARESKAEASQTCHLSARLRVVRWFLRGVFRGIFHLISRVTISGVENLPQQGAYIIAPNHVSLFDPPLVIAFWPTSPEAAGAVEIWGRKGQAQLVSWYEVIPVHRHGYDRQLLDRMLACLKAGRPLMIMPEGSRSHQPGMNRAEPGAAYIVEKTGVPVVPVGVVGTTDDFLRRGLKGRRPHVHMTIGKPVELPLIQTKGEARRLARQQNADLIMSHIAALLPLNYRGIYAEPAEHAE